MKIKLFTMVMIITTAALLLNACKGEVVTNPIAIPIPPKSQVDTGSLETTRKAMEDAERGPLKEFTIEMKAYTTTATMDELVIFFDEYLKGWTSGNVSEANGVQNVKWTAPNGTEHVVIIMLPPAGGIEGNPFFVEHAWKQTPSR